MDKRKVGRNMEALAGVLLFLTALNERVVEEFLGPWISGPWAKILAFFTGIGVTYLAWTLQGLFAMPEGLKGLTALQVLPFGVLVGLGSSVLHVVIGKYVPKANDIRLMDVFTKK